MDVERQLQETLNRLKMANGSSERRTLLQYVFCFMETEQLLEVEVSNRGLRFLGVRRKCDVVPYIQDFFSIRDNRGPL